ncbi:MAG: hypothetical protein WCJ35_26865 [Planctomycetota bacterium]
MVDLDPLAFCIMNAMADDWESINQIEPQVTRFFGPAERRDIFSVLRHIHESKYIAIRSEEGHELAEWPGCPETAWFCMTDLGRRLWAENGRKYE